MAAAQKDDTQIREAFLIFNFFWRFLTTFGERWIDTEKIGRGHWQRLFFHVSSGIPSPLSGSVVLDSVHCATAPLSGR